MKNARLVLLVSSILAVALSVGVAASAAGAPGGAKPKPAEFKPKVGDYVGTATAPNSGTSRVTGQVAKEGRKYVVQVLIQATSVCTDGEQLNAGVGFPVSLNGKAFKATEAGKDVFTGGTATWTVSGSFTSETALTGKAKKESTAGPNRPEVGTCTTGDVKFSLHFKK